MELLKAVKIIGSFVLAIIKIGIPFLWGLSFVFDWSVLIKFILFLISFSIVIIEAITIYMQVDN